MKYAIHIAILCCSLVLSSCKNNTPTGSSGGELRLSAAIDDMTQYEGTKAIGDEFFPEGGQIDVSIQTNNGGTPANYVYTYGADRIFRGSPAFRFTLDDNYITQLTATWPNSAVRAAGFVPDQRELADFKLADWMVSTSTASGIMPTDAPVPLTFERQNSMLVFEMVGQNTAGINITDLILELQVNGVPTACRAYCGDPSGKARLILPAGTELLSPDNYLIGRMSDDSGKAYTLIFPQTSLTLVKGTFYLVTLSPQGYNMSIYAYIGDFNDGEGGIGIPFEQPEPDADGTFTIRNFRQLVTMSYLVRHYYPDPAGFDWRSRTFILDPALDIDSAPVSQYIAIPESIFTGEIQQNGAPVTSITYGGGTLDLIATNN